MIKKLTNKTLGQIKLRNAIKLYGHTKVTAETGVSTTRLYEIVSGRKTALKMSLGMAKKFYDILDISLMDWFLINE